MSDVDTQIRTYLEATSTPIEPDEVMRSVSVVRASARRRPRMTITNAGRGWVVAAAVSVVVVIIFGAMPWMLRDRSPVPVSPDTPTVTTEDPNEDPAEADGAVGLVRSLTLDGPGAGIPAISLDIDGYVLSGLRDELLFSDDGVTWVTTPSDSGLDGYRYFSSQGEWAVAGDLMWRTDDGHLDLLHAEGNRWVRVATAEEWPDLPAGPPLPSRSGSPIADTDTDAYAGLATGDFGYLAYEHQLPPGEDGHIVRLWLSVDGTMWHEIEPLVGFDVGMGSATGAAGDLIYVGGTGSGWASIWIGHIGRP